MQNKLAVHQTNEIFSLGEIFAQSGLFPDATSSAQAIVKIMAGAELGLPPIVSMTGIHIVKGKVTLSATIMATILQQSGKYSYKVLELTEKVCKIEYYENDDKLGISVFSYEDAVKAKLAAKDNYKNYARNMLFARAMSNGVKWFCPEVLGGPVYTPEELDNEGSLIIDSNAIEEFLEKSKVIAERVKELSELPNPIIISNIKDEFGRTLTNAEIEAMK